MTDYAIQGIECPWCGEPQMVFDDLINRIVCAADGCSRRTAATEVLAKVETEHIMVLGETAFDAQHPLRERLERSLFRCTLAQHVSEMAPAWLADGTIAPGAYRMWWGPGTEVEWEAL